MLPAVLHRFGSALFIRAFHLPISTTRKVLYGPKGAPSHAVRFNREVGTSYERYQRSTYCAKVYSVDNHLELRAYAGRKSLGKHYYGPLVQLRS